MSAEVFDTKPMNTVCFRNPQALFKASDNFMTYFYLYRGKLKHKSLLKICQDREKKLEEKGLQVDKARAKEVEYLNKIRDENTEYEDLKNKAASYQGRMEGLEQEKYFLLQELLAQAEHRPRTSSTQFVSQEDNLESINEKLEDEKRELHMQIEDLKRAMSELESEDFRKNAEIKVAKRLLNKIKQEREELDTSQLNMTMQTEVHVKLFQTQIENENLREKIKKYDFAYKYLQKQLNEEKSISDLFAGGNKGNFDIANRLVNTLTMQVADRDQEIADLRNEIHKLKLDLHAFKKT